MIPGIYLQQNEMIHPVFEAWLAPFENLGCNAITIRNTSGTDHLSFDAIGLPAFQFIQDEIEYGRGYHTLMDTYERLVMHDLKLNAMITAALGYLAAKGMRNCRENPMRSRIRTAREGGCFKRMLKKLEEPLF